MDDGLTGKYALAGAISLGVLAGLHGMAWHALRRRWCAALALAFLLGSLIYAFDPLTRAVGDHATASTVLMATVALTLLMEGAIDFVALPDRFARWLRVGAITVAVITLGTSLAGELTRLTGAMVVSAYLAAIASLSLWAAVREPRCGHGLVFLAMMLFPAVVLAAWRGWFPVPLLRYAVVVPLVITGMTRLTTGLVRAQRLANEELRRAERAEAALRGLNESLERRVALRTAELHEMVIGLESFNRHVSHDLRGPLGGIAGAARLAREALGTGDAVTVARMLSMIGTQAESSVQLVGALLALARVGDAPFAPKRIALEALVRQALAQLQVADPHGDEMPVTLNTPLPEVEADPDLLRQVYVNLIGNAIKFSRETGAPRVEVGVLDGDRHSTFYVRDNGVGFDVDRAQNLFEPFQRLHNSHFPGHGVGLSIVKQIVQRHGGRVWVEAEPGRGATFFFTLGQSASA